MHGGRKARKAQEAAQESANEARAARADITAKENTERLKVQRKLIRGIKGRFNPFEFLPQAETLGGNPAAQNEGNL